MKLATMLALDVLTHLGLAGAGHVQDDFPHFPGRNGNLVMCRNFMRISDQPEVLASKKRQSAAGVFSINWVEFLFGSNMNE